MQQKDKNEALYSQLYRQLVGKIKDGSLPDGTQLPPERELAGHYQVSRITVRQALALLERDGYLVRRQGKGTFVQAGRLEHRLSHLYRLRDELAGQGIEQDIRILSWSVCPATGLVAEQLRLTDLAPVYELVRLISAGGQPLTLEKSYLPAALFKETITLEELTEYGLYQTLQRRGLAPGRAVERIRVARADKTAAGLLGCDPYEPCLQVSRTTDSGGLTVEYTVNLYRSDRFEYTVALD